MSGLPRIELRATVPGDVAAFFEHQFDPEASRMAAFTAPDPSDRAAFDARWDRILADRTMVKRTVVVDGAVVGHVVRFTRGDTPEVTYWIARSHWGRGVASRALAAFLDEVRARPLYARVAEDNRASRRVLEKCGFTVIARERGYAHGRGCEIDEVVMRLDRSAP